MANINSNEPNHVPVRRKRRRRRRSVWATVGTVLGTALLIFVTTGAILACFAAVYIKTVIVPQADLNLSAISLNLSSTMYYTDTASGELVELRALHGGENRVWVKYQDIPKDLLEATVAIEDKRFPKHHGVDWIRTVKGVLNMMTGRDVQGGSTLTQQLIKNITNEKEVTVKRKILEIFRALEFEKNYSKEEILEWYLNYIYLGEGCNGVYTASYAYFGKNVAELSLAQCASLISITNNPSIYNPYLSGRDKDGNVDPDWGRNNNAERAKLTLWNMHDQNKITDEEYQQAKEEVDDLVFQKGKDEERTVPIYSWYEDQVINDVIQDLMDTYHYSQDMAADLVYSGGLSIETCQVPAIQAIVDSVYQNLENLPYTSSSGQQLQSAIVLLDENGNVVALSGGMGAKNKSRIFNRATDTIRPPGSSFKPLSVYAPALEMGLITPSTVMEDTPYRIEGNAAWPLNAYGYYNGRMMVRSAVEQSSNPVALKTLTMVTPQASYDFLTSKLGFTSLVYSEERNGKVFSDVDLAPLSMGGLTDGVSTMEMAGAYATFPRGGAYVAPRTYIRVLDASNNVLLDNDSDRIPVPVVKERTAWYMNSMLRGVVQNGTAEGYGLPNMTTAGKTGSTNSNRDRWFVGYTPYYTAAVWTGYDQQERVRASGNPAAALWKKVMSRVHEGLENKSFPEPAGLVQVEICRDSGMLPSEGCALDPRGNRVTTGYFFAEDAPTQYCTVHSKESTIEICLDAPFLNDAGEKTGVFHRAGPYCPHESKTTVSMLDVDRERVGSSVARDDRFLMAHLDSMGEGAYCDVHTAPTQVPVAPFDPVDPSTWPIDDPNFDPLNPETWPEIIPPPTTPPPTDAPHPEQPEPTPPTPEAPDEDQPYIPAA